MTARVAAWIGLTVAVAAAAAGIASLRPPSPAGGTVPPEKFSSARAMLHVRQLASRARPIGTFGHDAARRYLQQELQDLGLEVETQDEVVAISTGESAFLAGRVQNVVARLRAASGTSGFGNLRADERPGAVALLAHYDSRPQTLGAADNAAGVATVLETVRALTAGDGLTRDVVVILTDGEELGLLGARAFVGRHRWMAEIGLLINVEARGNRGPSVMFETTAENLLLIEAFAEAVPYPLANSLGYEVYKRMPNDTDFSIFRERGTAGLSFAFFSNLPAYHTRLDTPSALDRGSVQQQGANVLAICRAVAESDGLLRNGGEAVYFSLPGWLFIHYRAAAARWLGLAPLLLGTLGLWGNRRGDLWTWPGVRKGMLLAGGAVAAGLAVASLSYELLRLLVPELFNGPHGTPYGVLAFGSSMALVIVVVVATLARRLESERRSLELLAGVLLAWAIASLIVSLTLPGASYLLTWPTLAGWITWWIAARGDGGQRPHVAQLATALGALPGIILFAPTLVLFLEALTLAGAGAPAVLLGLLLTLLAPQMAVLGRGGRARWVLSGGAVVALLVGVVESRPSPTRPDVDTLFYVAEESGAYWYSLDDEVDRWTTRFLGADVERVTAPRGLLLGERTVLRGPAPKVGLAEPSITASDRGAGDRVRVVRVAHGIGGQILRLQLSSVSGIEAVEIAGARFPTPRLPTEVRLTLMGGGEEPWRLQFEVADDRPLETEIVEQRYGFPLLEAEAGPRPPGLMASSSWRTDSTFVLMRSRL